MIAMPIRCTGLSTKPRRPRSLEAVVIENSSLKSFGGEVGVWGRAQPAPKPLPHHRLSSCQEPRLRDERRQMDAQFPISNLQSLISVVGGHARLRRSVAGLDRGVRSGRLGARAFVQPAAQLARL